ncbi:MAG: hypothetical protein HRT58_19015 [Crocinitomicaceae bacterium]|nr:hypothetical protein [Flavobacteriales bacterium]NQZ37762.1 hypothetical protein [Crocinitomicaceae bacterium]
MRTFLTILSISLMISSCSSEEKDLPVEIEPLEVDTESAEEKIIYRDTTHTFSDVGEFYSFGSRSYDTLISIKQKKYRLLLESRLDPDMRILHNQSYPDGDILNCYSSVGYQGHYTISLFEGEKTVFALKLTKEDFKKAEYSLILVSDTYLPQLIEYNETFNALVFQVPFNAEGSCWASHALLLIGLDGEIKLVDKLSGTGGNYANHDVQITADHSKLVSLNAIHYADGKSLSFIKENVNLMGVDLFDDCLLVVYENGKHAEKNTYLKDYYGKTLLNFKYEGWTGGLGYQFLWEKVKDAYYLMDETNNCLIRVQKQNGKWNYTNLSFANMDEFDGTPHPNDIMVDLSTEINEFTFYFDTASGKIRKITPEEY